MMTILSYKVFFVFCVTVVAATINVASSFAPCTSPTALARRSHGVKPLFGYVPDGMTPEQYKRFKETEKKDKAQKDFGRYGPSTFQSRSLQAFQKDLEKGKTNHLLPMFNAKEKLKKGKIKQEDIPYMQRGGSWDNTDVKGAKRKAWSSTDKNYSQNSAPAKFDWSGGMARKGPSQAAKKTTKETKKPEVKKLFGLF